MYVHSVKLINYKSIGNYPESEIILEPRVTAIIGKNESGKSNILEGLSRISFLARNDAAFLQEIVNRSCADGQGIEYIVTLTPSEEDRLRGILDDTTIRITNNSFEASGGFLDYCMQKAQPKIDDLLEELGSKNSNPMQFEGNLLASYAVFHDELSAKNKINIPSRIDAFKFLQDYVVRIGGEKQDKVKEKLQIAKDEWTQMLNILPSFYYRKSDRQLKTEYKFEDVEKELNNPLVTPNSLLYNFFKLLEVPKEDFINASRPGTQARQESLRSKIQDLVNDKINNPFQAFYPTESITLNIRFNAGIVYFSVKSAGGETLKLSERSNGLKWYLDTFIDAQANNIAGQNVVYLLDEPGIFLHVNAQKELLKLFQHLAEKGNQIVYTTHSPYMLDLKTDGIHRIRAVVKNEEGFSYIYKSAYDSRIAPSSQTDTLTPVISALGMSLYDTFGPAKDKINIITEGISDYIYLSTMAKLLGINTERYVFLPSVGARNCKNICSILHGWGCHYFVIFDYDEEGVSEASYLRDNMLLEYERHYCFVKDVSQADVDNKTYLTDGYVMEDVVTKREIRNFLSTKDFLDVGKPLLAKLMSNDIEKGTYIVSDECKLNFKALFDRLFSYCDYMTLSG